MAKDAIELLKADHVQVKEMLKKLTDTTKRAIKKRSELVEEIAKEIKVHSKIEEEIFYPAFKAAGGSDHNKMNYEALEEHRAVEKLVLPDLLKSDPGSEEFSGRAKVLEELIEHHADEEEESMFPLAAQTLSQAELDTLGEKMAARKEELRAQT
jgi:hemerythrin-like domain-containing protein